MAQKLNPWSGIPFIDANGNPRSGAQLFVYVAGSSTKQATTKDLAGSSAHENPVILNSAGQIADGSGDVQAMWQPEGVAVKLVLAPSTDTDPPIAAIDEWDDISGINDTSTSISQWITAQTPTFVSATTYTVAGDHTSDYHLGRRQKFTQTSGTEYGTIVTSVFTSLTTITMIMDGGVSLDSGLTQADLALITATNESAPNTTSLTQRWSKGTDIASATALPDSTDGNYADVTGTTAITSILTTGKVGTTIKRHFDGILTLTHDATNLILPGGANITTAAGDEAEFIEYASGDFRCTNYTKASGLSVVRNYQGASVATTSGTTVDITDIPAGILKFDLTISDVSTSGTDQLIIQLGTSGGVQTTGYAGSGSIITAAAASTTLYTTGFGVKGVLAANQLNGVIHFVKGTTGNQWNCFGIVSTDNAAQSIITSGRVILSGEITQLRITTVSGSDTFDNGSILPLY